MKKQDVDTRSKGFADVLVGLQYGDEGKAKIIDLIAGDYDCIVRFNGGANAGHTIETERGRIALKQVPSGVFHQGMQLYIGSGCVVDAPKLVDELAMLENMGIDLRGRFSIAARATLVQPHHVVIDRARFARIGTTKNGIGAAYADRALRMDGDRLLSLRVADLVDDPSRALAMIQRNLEMVLIMHPEIECEVDREIGKLRAAVPLLKQYVAADALQLVYHLSAGGRVLFEGAQSTALDVVQGAVPFVTSSHTVASAAFVGGDVPVKYHRKTIGVAKAVMSRVGAGPFVSEYGGERSESYCNATVDGRVAHPSDEESQLDAAAELSSEDPFRVGRGLRILSAEYGTGTRRPRRIGMFDLVQLRRAIAFNGVDELYITKCDLLHHYARTADRALPLVTSYEDQGQTLDYEPASEQLHRRLQPVITRLPAPSSALQNGRLNPELLAWVKRVESDVGCRVAGVGTGPARSAIALFDESQR
ncbi:MAG: hypothetical protein RL385_4757 [Pseudomonadota bacterium]